MPFRSRRRKVNSYRLIPFLLLLPVLVSAVSAGNSHSLSFDGLSHYVEVAADSLLNPTERITLEAWIKPLSRGEVSFSSTIVGMHDPSGSGEAGYVMSFGNSGILSISFEIDTDAQVLQLGEVQTPPVIELDRWSHIAATWDGSVITLYIDGHIFETVNCDGKMLVSANPFRIAKSSDLSTGSRHFNGLIDEVRIWRVCRTQPEIEAGMFEDISGESGLVGYWNFETGSGDRAFDSSGYGNDGVIHGASWSTDVPAPAEFSDSTWGMIKMVFE